MGPPNLSENASQSNLGYSQTSHTPQSNLQASTSVNNLENSASMPRNHVAEQSPTFNDSENLNLQNIDQQSSNLQSLNRRNLNQQNLNQQNLNPPNSNLQNSTPQNLNPPNLNPQNLNPQNSIPPNQEPPHINRQTSDLQNSNQTTQQQHAQSSQNPVAHAQTPQTPTTSQNQVQPQISPLANQFFNESAALQQQAAQAATAAGQIAPLLYRVVLERQF